MALSPSRQREDDGGGHTKDSYGSVPLRLDLDTLAWEFETCLMSWTRRIKEVARLNVIIPERRWGVPASIIPRLCLLLSRHLDVLLALPPIEMTRGIALSRITRHDVGGDVVWIEHRAAEWAEEIRFMSGTDAGMEILDMTHRIRQVIGLTPHHQRLSIPCPVCDLRGTLVRWDGALGLQDGAYCLLCGAEYTYVEYTLMVSEAYQRHLETTPSEGLAI